MFATIIDTNVLVYAYLRSPVDPRKVVAREQIHEAILSGDCALTTQVLTEFANVMLRKGIPKPDCAEIATTCRHLIDAFVILQVDGEIVLLALDGVSRFQLSYWDALIWATAKHNNVAEILTEDMPGGKTEIDGVRYRNPFLSK